MRALCRRYGVAGIVVGNPVKLDGAMSSQAEKVQAFAADLGELAGLPIHLWDERLTTHEAHQLLYEAGHARQDHKRVVDQVAATLILQSFLDRQADRPGRVRLESARCSSPRTGEITDWHFGEPAQGVEFQPFLRLRLRKSEDRDCSMSLC